MTTAAADANTLAQRRVSKRAVALAAIVALAALLRFVNLDFKGLWIDEVDWLDSTMVATLADAAKMGSFPHTPFFAIFMWPFQWLFVNDSLTRAIPAALGVLTVPLLYAIGSRLFTQSVGLFAALILALCPIHIDYSRQFEPYALAVFLVTATVLVLLRIQESSLLRMWMTAVVLTTFTAYANIFAVVVLGMVTGVLALRDVVNKRPIFVVARWTTFWCAALAPYVPFMLYSYFYRGRVHGLGTMNLFDGFFPDTYSVLENLQRFVANVWRDDRSPLSVPLLLLTGMAGVGIIRWFRSRPLGTAVATAWASATIVIFLICYLQRYQPIGRYFLPSVPGIALLLGASLHAWVVPAWRMRSLRVTTVLVAVPVLLPLAYWNVGAIAAYYVSPPVEDNKYLLKTIEEALRPADEVFLSIANPPLLVGRYTPDLIPKAKTVALGEFPMSIVDAATSTRVWFAYRTPRPDGIDRVIAAKGLHLFEFRVRGENTFIILLWPPPTPETAILDDTMKILETAAKYAGPNGPEVQFELERQSRQIPIYVRKEPAQYLLPALKPLRMRCAASPMDSTAFALLGVFEARLGNHRGAANAFAAALILRQGSQIDIETAGGLFAALRSSNGPPSALARLAMQSVHSFPVIMNSSFEEKDVTGRPRGWIVSPPTILLENTEATPVDGTQLLALQTVDTNWGIVAFPLKLNPDAMAGNRLVVQAHGQVQVDDTMYLQVDGRIDGEYTVLARESWRASLGTWTPLSLVIDNFPKFDEGSAQVSITLRQAPGRTCYIDNVSATLHLRAH